MNRLMQMVVVVAVGAAVLSTACGSTRFVVVDNQGAGQSSATTTAPPGSTGRGPPPRPSRRSSRPRSRRRSPSTGAPSPNGSRALSGADDLGPTFAAVVKIAQDLGVEMTLDDATVDGDTATAIVTVIVSGSPFAEGVPVPLVREGGKWRVTRAGACAVLALGSPCPDAPTG